MHDKNECYFEVLLISYAICEEGLPLAKAIDMYIGMLINRNSLHKLLKLKEN